VFGITVTYSLQQYLKNNVDMPLPSNNNVDDDGEGDRGG